MKNPSQCRFQLELQVEFLYCFILIINCWESVSVCHLMLCDKYIYLYNELVTLYNKVSFVNIS